MKIGDLFVRLGLKKDEFSRGLKEAKRETSTFGEAIKAVGSKGKIAFAAVAAAITGVIAAVKDLAKNNQALGDAIGKMSAGFSAMFDTLKADIAAMDFSNLLSDLREANKLARDLYDARDAMGEIGTSYNISSAEQLKRINDLKIALRDQSKTDGERIAAGEELLRIYKELEKNPGRGLERLKDKTLDYYMQRMGVKMDGRTDEQLAAMRRQYVAFFKWLGTAEGEAYSNAAKAVAKTMGGIDSEKGQIYMRNAANNGRSEFARLAVAYNDKIGDKDREQIERAVVSYYEQEAKYSGETLRIQTQINSIKSQASKTGASTADNERAQAERILQRAEDSAKGEIQILSEKYDKEKALLEKYGLETGALWEELCRNFKKTLEVEIPDEKTVKIKLDIEDPDMSEADEEIKARAEAILSTMEAEEMKVEEFLKYVRSSAIGGFEDACQELFDQFAGLEDINPGRIVQALLTPLADVAIRAGEIIIAEGVGVEACKKALTSLQGPAAIAAGAALIAIGTAAKSGLASLAKSGGKSTSASTYAGSSGSAGTQDLKTEMTVYVKGKIQGSDIVLAGQKTVNNWGR